MAAPSVAGDGADLFEGSAGCRHGAFARHLRVTIPVGKDSDEYEHGLAG